MQKDTDRLLDTAEQKGAMTRANRHFAPGPIWHLIHRCEKREFLLNFSRDRNEYIALQFKAKKRYHLPILNFIGISNQGEKKISSFTMDRLYFLACEPRRWHPLQFWKKL